MLCACANACSYEHRIITFSLQSLSFIYALSWLLILYNTRLVLLVSSIFSSLHLPFDCFCVFVIGIWKLVWNIWQNVIKWQQNAFRTDCSFVFFLLIRSTIVEMSLCQYLFGICHFNCYVCFPLLPHTLILIMLFIWKLEGANRETQQTRNLHWKTVVGL